MHMTMPIMMVAFSAAAMMLVIVIHVWASGIRDLPILARVARKPATVCGLCLSITDEGARSSDRRPLSLPAIPLTVGGRLPCSALPGQRLNCGSL
jgi:hypothetical protein